MPAILDIASFNDNQLSFFEENYPYSCEELTEIDDESLFCDSNSTHYFSKQPLELEAASSTIINKNHVLSVLNMQRDDYKNNFLKQYFHKKSKLFFFCCTSASNEQLNKQSSFSEIINTIKDGNKKAKGIAIKLGWLSKTGEWAEELKDFVNDEKEENSSIYSNSSLSSCLSS